MNLILLAILVILILLVNEIQSLEPLLKIAVISDGSPNDLGYNYQINKGLIDLETELNSTIMNYFSNVSPERCDSFIVDLIENKGYIVILAPSPNLSNCIMELSRRYLDRYFMFMGIKRDYSDRLMAVDYNIELINYICGFYAGLITKTNKVGYVASGPPLFNNYPVNSFYTGVYDANPLVTMDYYTIGSWLNSELSIGATKDLIDRGADIIGQNLQDMSVSLTSIENGRFAMGTNGFNQSNVFGKSIPFSYTLNWASSFQMIINAAKDNVSIGLNIEFRGDIHNQFIKIILDKSVINQNTIDRLDQLILVDVPQFPKSEYPYLCSKLNLYLYSLENSLNCITIQKFINISDPYPGMTYYGNYSIPTQLRKASQHVTKIYTILSAILISLALILSLAIIILKERPTFRFASPIFCILIILGGIIVYGGIIVWVFPVSNINCNLRLWLISEGFTVLIGSMVVKNLRIWLIFDNPKLKTIIITNFQLFPWIFILIIINSFLMAMVSYRGEVKVIDIFGVDDLTKYEYLQDCAMNQVGWISLYVLLCYFAVLLAVGVFVSWKIRTVEIAEFNESKPIANSLYTIAFGLIIIISLIISPQTYQNQTIILCTSGVFITTSTLFILFIPKLLNLNSHYFIQNRQSVIATLRYVASQPYFSQSRAYLQDSQQNFAQFTDDSITSSNLSKKSLNYSERNSMDSERFQIEVLKVM